MGVLRGDSLYFLFIFSVNLILLQKIKSINFFKIKRKQK